MIPMIIETKIFFVLYAIKNTIREGIIFKLTKGLKLKLFSQKTRSEKTSAEKMVTGINDSHFVRDGGISLFLKNSIGIMRGIKVAIAAPNIIIHLSVVMFTSYSILFCRSFITDNKADC